MIGLLNGLMIACGPLQAMYVMAAGTGSPVEGAKTLFVFGLGTLPVMLAFGALTTVLSGAVTHRLLTASGVIVVALGAVMINRGLILTGSGADLASLVTSWRSPAPVELAQPQQDPAAPKTQTIEMEANGLGFAPTRFTLLRGVPVKWVINATQVTNCNHRIVVPSLKLEFDIKPGRQTIEFTPEKTGVIPWSCWMGMMRGEFVVVDAKPAAPSQPSAPVASAVQGAPQATQSPPRRPPRRRPIRCDAATRCARSPSDSMATKSAGATSPPPIRRSIARSCARDKSSICPPNVAAVTIRPARGGAWRATLAVVT